MCVKKARNIFIIWSNNLQHKHNIHECNIQKDSVVVMCDLTNLKIAIFHFEIVFFSFCSFFSYLFTSHNPQQWEDIHFLFGLLCLLNCNTLSISYYTKVNSKASWLSCCFLDCITIITTNNSANTLEVLDIELKLIVAVFWH